MDKWTPDYWIANESECKKILLEPGNWEKVIKINLLTDTSRLVVLATRSTYACCSIYFDKNLQFSLFDNNRFALHSLQSIY